MKKCYICDIDTYDYDIETSFGVVSYYQVHAGVDDPTPLIICKHCHDILGLYRIPANTDALCTNVPELISWCSNTENMHCKHCIIHNKEIIRKNILLSRVT